MLIFVFMDSLVVCFHDSYSSFYMITIGRLGFENDMIQYRVDLNSSLSLLYFLYVVEFYVFEFALNFIF